MTDTPKVVTGAGGSLGLRRGAFGRPEPATLADILERVLDKGIVIAGDISINLLDIELLTIRVRLLIASVDRAREMGIDWWERDASLSSGRRVVAEERVLLRERVAAPGPAVAPAAAYIPDAAPPAAASLPDAAPPAAVVVQAAAPPRVRSPRRGKPTRPAAAEGEDGSVS
jgi:hypothetical protein